MAEEIIVIGGGASGLMAGIQAARKGAGVTVLEHMDRVGKKILSTGNGKCNLTNQYLSSSCYRSDNPEFPMRVIERFPVSATLAFFRELGILPKDKNGYIYPNSEQASSVLDVLRMEAEHQGVRLLCGCHVQKITRESFGGFQVKGIKKEGDREQPADFSCGRVILAAGSMAAPATGSDGSGYELGRRLGHRLIKPLPALVQLICKEKEYKALAGIRTEANIRLYSGKKLAAEDRGELQLTDYGISGIPVFQISRYASRALDQGRQVRAEIDFLPSMAKEELTSFLLRRKSRDSHKTGGEFLTGVLNKKLAAVLLKRAGIQAEERIDSADREAILRLSNEIHSFSTEIIGTKPFSSAQICCGGIDTREVDSRTMESLLVPGLYFAGEILDVDGICGGYNLQWAWSSGYLAGSQAAKKSGKRNQTGKKARS